MSSKMGERSSLAGCSQRPAARVQAVRQRLLGCLQLHLSTPSVPSMHTACPAACTTHRQRAHLMAEGEPTVTTAACFAASSAVASS